MWVTRCSGSRSAYSREKQKSSIEPEQLTQFLCRPNAVEEEEEEESEAGASVQQ